MALIGAAGPLPKVSVNEAARIIAMEPSNPAVRFVAVADGMILGLACSLAELEPWTRGRTVEVDRRFARNVLMPGLIDPHVHPMLAAVALNMPYLAPDDWKLPSGSYPGAQTQQVYRQRLAEMRAKTADFSVLDRTPYTAGAAGLCDVRVEGVIFEGQYTPA